MPINFEAANVAYFSVPKCACSSLKMFFFQAKNGKTWAQARKDGETQRLHEKFPSVPFKKVKARALKGLEKVAVVRAPIERVRSCYTNKVIKQQVLAEPKVAKALGAAGLSTAPSFEDFVLHLEGYRAASGIVRRHTELLSHWLGKDASFYDRLFDIKDLSALQELVAARVEGFDAVIPHRNISPVAVSIEELSVQAKEAMDERFKDDVTQYGHVFLKT